MIGITQAKPCRALQRPERLCALNSMVEEPQAIQREPGMDHGSGDRALTPRSAPAA